MKRKNVIIICFSVLLLLVAGFVGLKETDWNRTHSISVEIQSDGRSESVKLWMGPGEMYYLFLPSYADLSQTQVHRNVMGPVLLNYRKVKGSMNCSDLPLNEPVTLIQDSVLKYQWNELTIMQSQNVPTMYIDVRSGNMDYIHEKKGNKESGTMRLYTAEGSWMQRPWWNPSRDGATLPGCGVRRSPTVSAWERKQTFWEWERLVAGFCWRMPSTCPV